MIIIFTKQTQQIKDLKLSKPQ